MFVNRFRSLYSFGSVKPSSLVPASNTRWTWYFSTYTKSEMKPEDTFGDYNPNEASRYPEDNSEYGSSGSDIIISEAFIKMKKFLKKFEFDQAKEVFDKVKKTKRPPPHMYKLLFASAARLGKAEEAYKLYIDLKKRGLYADGAMFTSLFYACAKCPRSDVALSIADKLLINLFESKDHKPNTTNFNVILMAYGRHGDISTTMQMIDTLQEEGKYLTCATFNYALDSCVSQRNSGLRFAILIWHHMLRKKVAPNSYTFSALARCVRDCSLGDSALYEKFINSIFKNSSNKIINQSPKKGELVFNKEEESQVFCESYSRGGYVKEIGSFSNNDNDSKPDDTLSDVQSNQVEMIQSMRSVTLNIENDEKTQQHSHSVQAESSNNCSSDTGNKEESQCNTHSEIEASEKALTVTSGNNAELIGSCETTEREGSQLREIQPTDKFNSKVGATDPFDSMDLPNVLTLKPPGKSIINYRDFSTPENRLMLFGGLNGFLETVKDYKVKPTVAMFSILLECIPPTKEDEEALIRQMKRFRVKIDATFLNILIKRRALRMDESTPEDFLELFKKYKCAPNVITFGSIAIGCVTYESGKKCIELARSHNIRLNNAVLGCLLRNAGMTGDMFYVSEILKAAKEDDAALDSIFVSSLKAIVENEIKKRNNEFP